ncbi:MAG: acylphosphatase [Minisyncoccales bacterium]
MSNKKRVQLLISGRVQGVGFRMSARSKARKLDLKGWVKNLKNGKVKAVAEGEEKKIKEFIEWAKKGPFTAKVKNLEVNFASHKGEFNKFKIEY